MLSCVGRGLCDGLISYLEKYELKYPALLGIEDKVNCYLPTASTM
jgi:hypothetical protein